MRREVALALARARPNEPATFPLLYTIDLMARRYGLPPWAFDTDDPVVSRWLQRALLFASFEAQAKKKG